MSFILKIRNVVCTFFNFVFQIYTWLFNPSIDISKKGPIFVTGCDTGFGYNLALKLIQNGISTFAGCLTEDGERELREAAGRGPGKLWTVLLDVTDQISVDRAARFVKEKLGPGKGLWALVNNAGISGPPVPDDWLSVRDYQKTMDVNFFGLVRMTHTLKPMIKMERGRIVVTTSFSGRLAWPNLGPYSSSKYAAEAFCDVIRHELGPFGVTVHVLEPGFFATRITDPSSISAMVASSWKCLPPNIQKEYGANYVERFSICFQNGMRKFAITNTNLVSEAYFHALTSTRPKSRYVIGLHVKLLLWPLSMLPTTLQDLIFTANLRFNGFPSPRNFIDNH